MSLPRRQGIEPGRQTPPQGPVSVPAGAARLGAGALGGLLGGALMLGWMLLHAGVTGLGALLPLELIAALLYDVDALLGGAAVILAGLVIHVGVAAVLGMLFCLMIDRSTSVGRGLAGALLFATVLLLVMTYLALPVVNPVMRSRVALSFGPFALAHAMFAVGLAAVVPLWRWLEARHEERWRRARRARAAVRRLVQET